MISLKAQYLRLFDKAQGKALDPSSGMIYSFEKNCRNCGTGLTRPNQWDKRLKRKLFKKSYCSEICQEKGPVYQGVFKTKVPSSELGHKNIYPVEELAFVAVELKREYENMSPMKKLVHLARQNFTLLSEQLSFLELETGQNWTATKCRYWASKPR